MLYNLKSEIQNLKSGFTFIELLLVIAIIAGIASFVLFTYPNVKKKARDTQRQSDMKQYQTAMEAYANKNDNEFHNSSGEGNPFSICSTLGLTACGQDPMTGYQYKYISDPDEYIFWARLEVLNESGNVQYFVTCSNGQAGYTETEPSSVTCPALN